MHPAAAFPIYLFCDLFAVGSILLILRFVFLKRFSFHVLPAVLTAAGILGNAWLCTRVRTEEPLGLSETTDLLSTLLMLFAAYVFFEDRKQARTFFRVILYDAGVDVLYSLCAPYVPDAYWVKALISGALYALAGGAVLLAAKTARFNVLPEIFDGIPGWVYAVIFLFELTCYYREFGEAASWYRVLYTVSVAAILLCVFYLICRVFALMRKQTRILEQLALQKEEGARLRDGDEELRRFRHDYRNHMMVVNALLSAGKTEEAQRYLTALSGKTAGAMREISTGNVTADSLLNYKAEAARAHGVTLRFFGSIPPEGIRDEDLCTILSNLADNAVEAAEKLSGGDRQIVISAGMNGDAFFLNVKNPTDGTGGNGEQTTKPDKRSHGYGLKNVRRVARAYNGELVTAQKDGIFTAELVLQPE